MTDENSDLENLLSRYTPADPPTSLRTNILHHARTRTYWSYAQAAAALLLISLNLLQINASLTQIHPTPAISEARTQQLAATIQSLDLPLTTEETTQLAHQLAAAETIPTLPLIHGYTHNDSTLSNGATP